MRASVLSSRNCVGAARFSTLRSPVFCFRDLVESLGSRTSCEDLGKTRPARCQVGDDAMPLFSLGMDFKEHPQYAYMKLKSIQEAVAKFGRP